ncbi:MFS transporter [Microlunatus speluncae]|uniref:MFS transporter n=1 Tax=Microlunatus speluncae TaxID=2594267 RepID=UPI001266831D|nr:MFS transporter [Microlunatus speluncae]
MPNPYRTLWSTPAVLPALTAVFVSALPIGMAGLAIILTVQHWTGSLPLAGLLAGVFSAGNAVGLLAQGRILSHWNPALVIMITGLVSALGFALLIMIGYGGATPVIMIILVAICGVTVPAITTAVRAWLPLVVADDAGRTAGYALLTVLFQGAILLGPMLVSLAVAAALPAASLGLIALLLLGSVVLFRQAVRTRQAGAAPRPVTRGWWRHGLGWLLAVSAGSGLATGITTVAVPGVMTVAGVVVLAGVVASAAALGDVVGALGYGSRAWPGRPWTRLAIVAGGGATVGVIALLVAGVPWLLVLTGFAGGLLAAPQGVVLSGLLDRVVPAEALARGYSSMVCAGLLAGAVGSTLAAALLPVLGERGLLLLPPIALAGAATVALMARRSTPE